MGDYPRFLGNPAFKSPNRGPRFVDLFPACRGTLTFRLSRGSRSSASSFLWVPLPRQSSCLFRKTVYDMTRQTFRIPSWPKSSVSSSQNCPIIAWFLFDLHPCSHLGTLWRPLFAELPLRKVTIAFCEYFDAKGLRLLERRKNFHLLN